MVIAICRWKGRYCDGWCILSMGQCQMLHIHDCAFQFPLIRAQVTEMLVNVLNICSDDELMSDTDDALEEGNLWRFKPQSHVYRPAIARFTLLLILRTKLTLVVSTCHNNFIFYLSLVHFDQAPLICDYLMFCFSICSISPLIFFNCLVIFFPLQRNFRFQPSFCFWVCVWVRGKRCISRFESDICLKLIYQIEQTHLHPLHRRQLVPRLLFIYLCSFAISFFKHFFCYSFWFQLIFNFFSLCLFVCLEHFAFTIRTKKKTKQKSRESVRFGERMMAT